MDGVTVKISVFLESDRSLSGGRRQDYYIITLTVGITKSVH